MNSPEPNIHRLSPKKFKIVTLGCKVNQYESQLIRENLQSFSYQETLSDEEAEVFIINSCTVTGRSEQKTRKLIRSIKRRNPGAIIIVTGCYVERAAEELKQFRDINLIVRNEEKMAIGEKIHSLLTGLPLSSKHTNSLMHSHVSDFENRTRAFVKIQDGCESFCSYCIIPYVRGPVQSKSPDSVISEVETLTQRKDIKEIVLTGIHLGHYGKETIGQWNLVSLLLELVKLPHTFRIRLSSIESTEVSENLLEIMSKHSSVIMPHLHIPLQSGDDRILKAMNRHYTTEDFFNVCEKIRNKLSRPAITTDVIVGFPGETLQEFENTVSFCQKVNFSRMHIFPYADREGTKASLMQDKVSEEEKKERVQKLTESGQKMMYQYHKHFEGEAVEVLVEEQMPCKQEQRFCGVSERYIRVYFPGHENLVNRLVKVQITKAKEKYLIGELIQ